MTQALPRGIISSGQTVSTYAKSKNENGRAAKQAGQWLLADITRFDMPMFFFQFEVRPKQTHPKRDKYGGATVNCWVLRDTQSQAEAVARGWIGDEDWRITEVKEAILITSEIQAEHPKGMQYFKQAEIDREVFVFHTWPTATAP